MQRTPEILPCLWFDGLVGDPASANPARAMQAMLQMKKVDLAKIRRACDGAA